MEQDVTEPDWIGALRTRAGMRLLRSWGESDARTGSSFVQAGWRDDGTFVAVDNRGLRGIELDPRTGAHRTLRTGDHRRSVALMEGARAVVRTRVPDGRRTTELEIVSLPGLSTLRQWTVEGLWRVLGASAHDVVLAEEQPFGRFTDWPEQRVAVVPVGEGRRQEIGPIGSMRTIVDGARWLVTARGALLTCWDVGARAVLRQAVVEGGRQVTSVRPIDEARVSVGGPDFTALWNLRTGELSVRTAPNRDNVLTARVRDGTEVQVSHSGKVSWSREGALLEAREVGRCSSAWVSPDLDCVVVTNGRALGVVARGRADLLGGWPFAPTALAWSDNGRLLAVIDIDTSRVLDVERGHELWSLEHGESVCCDACFDRAGRFLYTVGMWDFVAWDLARGQEVLRRNTSSVGPLSEDVDYAAITCSVEGDRVVAYDPLSRSQASPLLMIEGDRVWEEVPPAPEDDGSPPRPDNVSIVAASFDAEGRLVVVESANYGGRVPSRAATLARRPLGDTSPRERRRLAAVAP